MTTLHPMRGLLESLTSEWQALLRAPNAAAESARLADIEPALAQGGVAGAVAGVTWRSYRPVGDGGLALSALLRQAGSPLAARALLQALLPRLAAENVYTPTYGHQLDEHWQSPADTAADLVAECFAAIKRHAGEDRQDVDRLLVGQAARRLRTARQARRRQLSRTTTIGPSHASWAARGLDDALTTAERVAQVLVEAVQGGRIAPAQASLVYAARVKGIPASEVGRRHGMAPRAIYYALERAEQHLVGSLA